MTPLCRRFVGMTVLSTALLVATEGSAAAASPTRPVTAVRQSASTARLPAMSRAPTGLTWGARSSGYPVGACTPSNDGAEVTTMVLILNPLPIAALLIWVCDGATGTWQRR